MKVPYRDNDSWQNQCDKAGRRWYGYRWTPHQPGCAPAVEKFYSLKPCDVIHGKSLLIIGDSISYQTFCSLLLQQGIQVPEKWQGTQPHFAACNNTSTVSYIRNDCLSDNCKCGDVCQQFWVKIKLFDIVVVNRGAHARFVTPDSYEAELQGFARTFKQLFPQGSKPMLVFRSTMPGHLGHGQVTGDRSFRAHGTAAEYEDVGKKRYDWEFFEKYNYIAFSVLSSQLAGRFQFVDSFALASQRADRHLDPLHYCLPGPPDDWVRLLLVQLHNHYLKAKPYAMRGPFSALNR